MLYTVRVLEGAAKKCMSYINHRNFALRCKDKDITLTSLKLKTPLKTIQGYKIIRKAEKALICERFRLICNKIESLEKTKQRLEELIVEILPADYKKELMEDIRKNERLHGVIISILCLIFLICFTTAYFTMDKKKDQEDCPKDSSKGKQDSCDINIAIEKSELVGQQEEARSKNQAEGTPKSESSMSAKRNYDQMSGSKECASMKENYIASMVLSGVGDALGYYRGKWEFNTNGQQIHQELRELGGLTKLNLAVPDWIVSDDTVMHIATAEALAEFGMQDDKEVLFDWLKIKYIECMGDMKNRAAGPTTIKSIDYLRKHNTYKLPFDSRGGGCGAAMRAMCIGLRYPREKDLDDLIAVSIESGRMTHHHPTGYLGALASALFTHYAVQKKPVAEWGKGLMDVLPAAKEYIKRTKSYAKENLEAWSYFETQWDKYLNIRKIRNGESKPVFKKHFDVKERDDFYAQLSFSGWGGASGHDAPMIAYDAILGAGNSWEELCLRGMLHGGDSDSTGAIAAAWFGVMYGFSGVPKSHYEYLEYRERLEKLGEELYSLSHFAQPNDAKDPPKEEDEKSCITKGQRKEESEKHDEIKDQPKEDEKHGEIKDQPEEDENHGEIKDQLQEDENHGETKDKSREEGENSSETKVQLKEGENHGDTKEQ